MKEQYFKNGFFQLKWKRYKKLFGEDLDVVFGVDYDKKIRLAIGLEYLAKKQYNDDYHEIRHFVQCCVNDVDRDIINRLIKICYNEEEMHNVKEGDWIKKSSSGYYKVIKKTPNEAIIKQAFDFEMSYAKESKRINKFNIKITDLKTFQVVEKNEFSKLFLYAS